MRNTLKGFVPWPEEFARRYREKGYWEGLSIAEVFEQLAAKHPDREALFDCKRRISYGQLWQESGRLAAGFVNLGFRHADRVVFQLPNSAEFFISLLALMRIGVIPVMALPPHRRNEIQHFILGAQAVGLLIPATMGDFDFRAMAEEIRPQAPTLSQVLVLGEPKPGQVSLAELLATPVADAEVARLLAPQRPSADDVALILLSGGTTALPKMIARTHNDYVYNFKQAGAATGMDADTVVLAVMPLAHNAGLASPGSLAALVRGGRVVIAPDRSIETCLRLVQEERVTTTLLTPPLAIGWAESPLVERFDLSSLKNVVCGGARMPPEMRTKLRQRLRCICQEGYGNGEGLLAYVPLDDTIEHLTEATGIPVSPDDEIRVVDDFGRELPDGEAGELLTRGPYTIRGYYDNPEANAKAFTEDGFYRTGDVVCKRGRYIYHQGRKKELINRGGEKISCSEVEDHIIAHPAVADVVLVGMPDPRYGEKACAFVILKPQHKLSLEELNAFLLKREIAKFKLPERMEIVDSFPLSPAGKVLRRSLREMIEAKIEDEKGAAR